MLELARRPGEGNHALQLLRAMAFVRFQQPLPPPPTRKTRVGLDEFYGDYDTLADLASTALRLPLPGPYVRLPPVRRPKLKPRRRPS